ncbi:MAG: PPC domain-containing protein [Cyanobacteria bacterium P01_D01_bin.73]
MVGFANVVRSAFSSVAGVAIAGLTLPAIAVPSDIYQPQPLPASNAISDEITTNDIPTGTGGFARDYRISAKTGDRLEIELSSDEFDTVVMLIANDGTTLVENDDRGDGSTHSRIFTSIDQEGEYTIRVQSFGSSTGGKFDLKVTRLRAL